MNTETGTPLALSGELTLAQVAGLWPQLASFGGGRVDTSQITHCDGAGAALLFELVQRGAVLEGLPEECARQLAALQPDKPLVAQTPANTRRNAITRLGSRAANTIGDVMDQVAFIGHTAVALCTASRKPRTLHLKELVYQCTLVGANAVPIVSLIALLLGVILAFQSAIPMRQFGAEIFVANLLGLSLIRELGPLMTAILLAGRTGAAFAAEIGTMKVNEEINALTTFGFDPVRFLVLPRLLAGMLMAPLLTLYANLVGLIGGALVMKGFGIPFATFWSQLASQVHIGDLVSGLAKATIFGLIIATVGCQSGMATGNGASAVGASTTTAVVRTLVLLVVADGLFAVVYYFMGW